MFGFFNLFKRKKQKQKKFSLHKVIPGLISGSAGNDPAGITTYSVVGATTGFQLLFLSVLAIPILVISLSLSALIGDIKKQGLSKVINLRFGKRTLFLSTLILLVCNISTIAADFSGMGAAFKLIFPKIHPVFFLPLATLFILYLIIFKTHKTIQKYFLLFASVFVLYIFAGFLSKPNWSQVFQSIFLPKIKLDFQFWAAATGLLGTTISPFLFYWQTREEVEESHTVEDGEVIEKEISIGAIYIQMITFFIILTTASTLFVNNIPIETAYDAALALKPIAGSSAFFLFAIGILGSGFLSIPIIAASTAYALAEIFNLKEGVSLEFKKAKPFYFIITAVLLIGLSISLLGINPIKILFYSQVLNGLLAPFLLFLILKITNDRQLMGKHANTLGEKIWGSSAILIMAVSGVMMVVSLI